MFGLYKDLRFQRVYFSEYQKGLGDPGIPGERFSLQGTGKPFVREHRLYQADFLLRKYGFGREDILFDESGNLRLDKDPKEVWADGHPEYYPVRINTSDRESLLRVPGLGPETVGRILQSRRECSISRLEDLGLKGKRLEKVKGYVVLR
jgi:predicted DNA-binding helix-hairpin-helix protein